MSLEQALADNTAALKALTAALSTQLFVSHPAVLADQQAMNLQAAATLGHPQPTVAPVPPPPPTTALDPAPYTVAAPPPPTAPAVPTATSPEPTAAFAPAAPASVAPVTPAAPPTASPALDAKGLPWDGRIHAPSKALVADGSWRMKRGVDAELVKQVTAELQAATTAPVPTASSSAPSGLANVPWPFATSQADVQPLPVPPPPPPPPASPYAALMSRLTHHINVGDIKLQQVTDACMTLGVPSVAALATREDLVPYVASALGLVL